ncbi:MAG: EFR1 family ferrodoxin [Spirochaetota bacterium]
MTVFYFTSTGNCLYVARQFGGTPISIPQALCSETSTYRDDAIGIVVPCYFFGIPRPVQQFLRSVTLESPYVFGIVTYGGMSGGTVDHLRKVAEKNGIHFSYLNEILMVDNYLPMYEMGREKAKLHRMHIDSTCAKIKEEVAERKQSVPKKGAVAALLTTLLQKQYRSILKNASARFSVEKHCNGCGICADVCPAGNITMAEEPVYGSSCEFCLACTHNCPQNAIRVSGEKSRERFRNDHVQLSDIVAANRINKR